MRSTTCHSQADCGGGVLGREAFDYPECVEQWDGGIKLCDRRCEGPTDASSTTCEALGGSCAFLTCTWPTCDSVPDAQCVDPVTDADLCSACCSEEVGGREELYLAQISALCGCDAAAPCAAECAGMCQSGGVETAFACTQCVFGLPDGTPCLDAAIDACFADAGCSAYYACLNRRQCP